MNAADAKARTEVQLADGRTGWLIYWPIPNQQRRTGHTHPGGKARVVLETGQFISVPINSVSPLCHPADDISGAGTVAAARPLEQTCQEVHP